MELKPKQNEKGSEDTNQKPVFTDQRDLIKNLYSLSRKEILGCILKHENPRKVVQELPHQDFFWLVKKIGEDDCLPLLEFASIDQWQYLLDLEIWRKDRLYLERTSLWLNRLLQADPGKLVKWLYCEGRGLAYYYLFRSIKVEKKGEDEVYDLQHEFFSHDGVFFIKIINSKHRDTIEHLLRRMASEDMGQYQGFLLEFKDILPSEVEEEMYRLRNIRVAENGFLPFEEAISVYAPINLEALSNESRPGLFDVVLDEEIRAMVPVAPLFHAGAKNLLTECTSRMADPILLDRIRLEFAGLCNQILSADGLLVDEPEVLEVLIRTSRKAAGYLNLALEKMYGDDISSAEQLFRGHPLFSIFRAGFGLVLKLKWEAESWLKSSWFYRKGLEAQFWGKHWGETLAGLLYKKPLLYVEAQDGEGYKDFERLSELDDCRMILHRLMALDRLLKQLADLYQMDERPTQSEELTFHTPLFNLWARRLLKLEPCFSGISLRQAKDFFRQIRAGIEKPPYLMPGFEKIFVENFLDHASDFEPELKSILKDTLAHIWEEFHQEHEWVSAKDLDQRYSKFVSIM
ncbi:MAG: DUF6178 family protein [Desulfatiglandales bacterium]